MIPPVRLLTKLYLPFAARANTAMRFLPESATYILSSRSNATFIGFTGTPVDKTAYGKGTFKTFGGEDDKGYLHKYSIAESIEDARTQLRPANPACRIDFESIQALPVIDEPSEVKLFSARFDLAPAGSDSEGASDAFPPA